MTTKQATAVGWSPCPSCHRERRTLDGLLISHRYYNGFAAEMQPCSGSQQEPLPAGAETAEDEVA